VSTSSNVALATPGSHTSWLRDYSRTWLRPDIVAGLTAAAVVIPKAFAYATIAGLPLQAGLYTALLPMAIYALLGTSRPLSVSTTTTIAILTASALALVAPGNEPGALLAAASTLTVLVGITLLVATALRLGFVANFISEPVLVGFKSGIGLVIIVDQLPKLLGIHIDKSGFLRNVLAIVGHLPDSSQATVLLSLATLAIIFLLARFAPRAPAPLIAVAAAIGASMLLGLESAGVSMVGEVPQGLPSLVLPQWSLAAQLWPAAAGIALMSFTETIASGRAFAVPGEPRPVPNRELFAIGMANVGGGLFGSMAAGGGTTQTAVNRKAGARSQAAELVTAAVTLATLLLLAPLIASMPQAVLAAVVIATSIDLFKPKDFREIRRVRTTEFRWALIAFTGVILLGTLQGIVVAIVASLLSLAMQTYRPPVYALARKPGTTVFRPIGDGHPGDEQFPGLLLIRVEGRVFFANAQSIGDAILPLVDEHKPAVLVIDCRAITDLEFTAIKMLAEARERLALGGTELWLAGMNPAVFAVIERSSLGKALGRERMFLNLQGAVEQYQKRYAR
jgi:high affinity sulfate transporter 1